MMMMMMMYTVAWLQGVLTVQWTRACDIQGPKPQAMSVKKIWQTEQNSLN